MHFSTTNHEKYYAQAFYEVDADAREVINEEGYQRTPHSHYSSCCNSSSRGRAYRLGCKYGDLRGFDVQLYLATREGQEAASSGQELSRALDATFGDSVFMLESSDSTNDGQRVRVIRGSGKAELLGQVEP